MGRGRMTESNKERIQTNEEETNSNRKRWSLVGGGNGQANTSDATTTNKQRQKAVDCGQWRKSTSKHFRRSYNKQTATYSGGLWWVAALDQQTLQTPLQQTNSDI